MKKSYIFALSILLLSSAAFAQVIGTKNLSQARGYETVILSSAAFPLLDGVSRNELYLYSFTDGQGWKAIPFQIDEKGTADAIFNINDEFLFLAQDLGDRVSLGNWIDDANAQENQRYEIEIVDRRDESKKGWCYLFRSTSLTAADRSTVQYLTYVDSSQVQGKYYSIDKKKNRFYPEDIRVTSLGGGTDTDIYDRTKLRISAIPYPGIEISIPESLLVVESTVFLYKGPIRIEHRINLNFDIPNFDYKATFTLRYYPYSTKFSGKVELLEGWHFKLLRMSYDLNEAAVGMSFYSGDSSGMANNNISIDGVDDTAAMNNTLAFNSPSWTLATGAHGTMFTINDIHYNSEPTNPEPYTQLLYYKDDASAEDPADTGDKLSYGDHGMIFESDDLVGNATYESETYLLAPNKTPGFAQEMFYNFNTPVMVNPRAQTYAVDVDLAQVAGRPESFRLHANYPNPFNPSTTISFEIPASGSVQLRVYDVQGKLVATLLDQRLDAGIYRQAWNGTNDSGAMVGTGVYFYQITTDRFSDTRKMIFVK
jgi:hypothetical protein